MTYMSLTSKTELYKAQDAVLKRLFALDNQSLAQAKLCGGTALARFWLDHRISYDLDFFLPEGFRAGELARALKKGGIQFEVVDLVDDLKKANQLHGYVALDGADGIKVSFVEDAYFTVYPSVKKSWNGQKIATESIDGLYHRKLRTVAGSASEGDAVIGGPQTARDLFDLYVLSKVHMPLLTFIKTVPYHFPLDAFCNGLVSMPWFDLAEELSQIQASEKWHEATSIETVQAHLLQEIGCTPLDDLDTPPWDAEDKP
jgi:Nucleotidyl transferase AbiEii toxin, Type IV TA system